MSITKVYLFISGFDIPSLLAGKTGKQTFQGCEIDISSDTNKISLNLKDKSCQDIMSIPRLFEKLTGKNMEDSKLFAPLAKFNVDSVNLDRNTKDVSFAASAKEPFQLMPGTSVKV